MPGVKSCLCTCLLLAVTLGCDNDSSKPKASAAKPRDKSAFVDICRTILTRQKVKVTPSKIDRCAANFASMPPDEADTVIACIKKPGSDLNACAKKSRWARERYERDKAEARAKLLSHRDGLRAREDLWKQWPPIRAFRAKHGRLPESLGELERFVGKPVVDSWKRSLRYKRMGDRLELCGDGPDGKRGTADDQCETFGP